MGLLDRAALLMSPTKLHLALTPEQVNTAEPAHSLMPYEIAEIEECSISFDEAVSHGDEDAAPVGMCQWHA